MWMVDARGRVLTSTDPEGGVASLAYDADGSILATTDPALETTTHVYALGRRIETRDAIGHVSRVEYDAEGNALTLTRWTSRIPQGPVGCCRESGSDQSPSVSRSSCRVDS